MEKNGIKDVIQIRYYGGMYDIKYNIPAMKFEALSPTGKTLQANTESELIDKMDAATKRAENVKKSKLFPMDVLWDKYGEVLPVKITSVDDDGDFWVTWVEKNENKREKVSTRYSTKDFYEVTPANLSIAEKIHQRNEALEKLHSEIADLRHSLKPLDTKELLKKLVE